MKRLLLAAAVSFGMTTAAHAEQKYIAIASFGEHPALQLVIDGLKESMKKRGYDVRYTFDHVNWERNLIPQMLQKVASRKPDVVVTITTPVTQTAKRAIKSIPVVFAAVQDPVVAGVIPSWDKADGNMTGASNLVDMDGTVRFIKQLLPNAKVIGLPYNPGDDADNALRERLEKAVPKYGMTLKKVGVDNVNDLPQRLQQLKGVDAIYIIPSNLFQPATAQIGAITMRMGIPTFNGLPAPVEKDQMIASYSVNWPKIGYSAAGIIEKIFKGTPVGQIKPTVPTPEDHSIVISKKVLDAQKVTLPASLKNCDICTIR